MLIKEMMTKRVEVVAPDATIQDVARKMKSLDIGSLPVCAGSKIQGMITDRDIALRVVAAGLDPTHTSAKAAMSTELHYCFDDEPVQAAAGAMQRYQVRRLPIINRTTELVGIVALGDLAADTDNQKLAGATLERVSERSKHARQR